jgi:L-ascorbate metabolism protein UlaG (beta-lactamase superfamily)
MPMNVTWLGQSSFVFEYDGYRLVVDPFLSDIVEQREGKKRLMAPPLSVEEIRPDALLITHDHIDHFDPIALPEIHRAFPSAPVVGPESVLRLARTHHFESCSLELARIGSEHRLGPFAIKPVPAWHSDPSALGFLVTTDERRIYLSGDTLLKPQLIEALAGEVDRIDVMFVVINGKGGNMSVDDAVSLAARLRPRLAIPTHYGMFAENTEDPQRFIDGCCSEKIDCRTLVPGAPTAM